MYSVETGGPLVPRIDLLHLLGDAPEGPRAIFSLPVGDGTDMVSVIVPRSLWLVLTRAHPFDSEISLMEKAGRAAVARALDQGGIRGPVFVTREDIDEPLLDAGQPWFKALRLCGRCGADAASASPRRGVPRY